jgi:hypothetical protein
MKPTRLLLLALAAAVALLAVPAVSQARDRNHDGLPDKWEKHFHLSLHKNQAQRDPDRDRVDNANEFREHTNPRSRDTNHNGRPDGREDRDRDHLNNAAEDATGNDPIDRDTDNDGIPDGQEQAGVVSSFNQSTGDLTIDLANGGSVTGRVTAATEVKCETENEAEDHETHAIASHDGENSGPGSENSGPGSGDDRGDDNPGEVENENENEQGDERGEDEARRDECPAGALAQGARVHEAELNVLSSGAVWTEIELLTP